MNPFIPPHLQTGIVLASKSPRRIDLLRAIEIDFVVDPAHVGVEDQELDCGPSELPSVLAGLKAENVAGRHPGSVVIGADTVVIVDGELLEKPRDDGEAAEFLHKLNGRIHEVITGLAVRKNDAGVSLLEQERTRVRFRDLTRSEIESYVASGEGRDKAGSYAIQGLGAGLVRSVDGCFYNVVGLPIALLIDMLKRV
jgi:septum formation protein